ncbi:MAG: zinc-binding metallopeptidase family protein [Planctomycetota bacterium]|jgi:endoglucanase
MERGSLSFLKKLLTTPTVSGHESAGQKLWVNYVRRYADEVTTDSYGNAVAILKPRADTKVVVDGHIDEIGLVVKHITDEGFIHVQRVGGVHPPLLQAKRVNIHGAKGMVRGVVGASGLDRKDSAKIHEITVDIAAKDGKEAKRKVAVGDPITLVDEFEMITRHVAVARAFDDRIGAWVAAETIRRLSTARRRLRCSVVATSSVQEEVGLRGAMMNAFNIEPDAFFAVDVTHATDTPGVNHNQHGKVAIGDGPTIQLGRENHPVLTKLLRSTAKKKDIPVQVEAFLTTGATNAAPVHSMMGGIASAVVSIATRYIHTAVEMIDLRDADRAADLLTAVCLTVKPNQKFKVRV